MVPRDPPPASRCAPTRRLTSCNHASHTGGCRRHTSSSECSSTIRTDSAQLLHERPPPADSRTSCTLSPATISALDTLRPLADQHTCGSMVNVSVRASTLLTRRAACDIRHPRRSTRLLRTKVAPSIVVDALRPRGDQAGRIRTAAKIPHADTDDRIATIQLLGHDPVPRPGPATRTTPFAQRHAIPATAGFPWPRARSARILRHVRSAAGGAPRTTSWSAYREASCSTNSRAAASLARREMTPPPESLTANPMASRSPA